MTRVVFVFVSAGFFEEEENRADQGSEKVDVVERYPVVRFEGWLCLKMMIMMMMQFDVFE